MYNILGKIFERRVFFTFLLGISSGLPLALFESTLRVWYTTAGIDIQDIGFLTLISLPCVIRFFWAPAMDYYSLPFLCKRRSWIFTTQLLTVIILLIMAVQDPVNAPLRLAILAFILSFLSSSQDIAIDAYRTDILTESEKPFGSSMSVNGFRIGMLISGGMAIIYADTFGWHIAYTIMALLMLLGMIVTVFSPRTPQEVTHHSFKEVTFGAFKELMSRKKVLYILLLMVTYKLGCEYGTCLLQPFLIRKIGLTISQMGHLSQEVGFFSAIIGGLLGGFLIERFGTYRSLIIFGSMHMFSNLGYMSLLWIGESNRYIASGAALFVESLCGGMATAAFVSLMMSLCNKKYTAFQFAVLSSFGSMGRVFTGPPAALIVIKFGWEFFYISSVLFSLPGLWLLFYLKPELQKAFSSQGS